MTRAPSPPMRSARPGAFLAAAAVLAVLAYAAGRSSAELLAEPSARGPGDPRMAERAAAGPAAADGRRSLAAAPVHPWSPAPALGAPPTGASGAAAPLLTPAGRPTRELVARVAAEASRSLEQARGDLVARCVPPGSATSAKLTFNLAFDAQGREVARGISDDRRAPAPEVAGCLRRLPMGSLRVSAPGTHVGVRVAMQLP